MPSRIYMLEIISVGAIFMCLQANDQTKPRTPSFSSFKLYRPPLQLYNKEIFSEFVFDWTRALEKVSAQQNIYIFLRVEYAMGHLLLTDKIKGQAPLQTAGISQQQWNNAKRTHIINGENCELISITLQSPLYMITCAPLYYQHCESWGRLNFYALTHNDLNWEISDGKNVSN